MPASDTRPVYVLGAGFSAAISRNMPLTNEVGRQILNELSDVIDVADLGTLDFEDWLSVRVAPLPFLEGHENARRLADAQRAIAFIGDLLEKRTIAASEQAVPLWLHQIIALWHAERALVITFNYDTLIERAVNSVRPSTVVRNDAQVTLADDVVFPSPTPPPATTRADRDGSIHESFQLLKVHGSINWFWNASDASGSNLTRARERSAFDNGTIFTGDRDWEGIALLDRFLVPPVATKSNYYTPPLTKILWRTAGQGIGLTRRLTLIGYSMPATDRATVELLREAPEDASVQIVNRTIGDSHDWRTLAARTAALGDGHPKGWDGVDCVSAYVSRRVDEAVIGLAEHLASAGAPEDHLSVVVTFPAGRGLDRTGVLCALAERDGIIRPVEITASGVQKVSGGSPIEAALNSQAPGSVGWDDFVDVGKLRARAAAGSHVLVEHEGKRWVAISAEEIPLHRSRALMLHLSPFG